MPLWAFTVRSIFQTGFTGEWVVVASPAVGTEDSLLNPFRYYTEGAVDVIAVMAGLVQTGLFADFFYIYFTKYVPKACTVLLCVLTIIFSL